MAKSKTDKPKASENPTQDKGSGEGETFEQALEQLESLVESM